MIKQKRIAMALILLAGVLLCGCAQRTDPVVKEEADSSLEFILQEQSNAKDASTDVTAQDETAVPDKVPTLTGIAQLNTQLFNGEEADLWYGNDNILIVKKQTMLYAYQVNTGEIISKTDTKMKEIASLHPYENGYCIIGSRGDSAQGKEEMLCIFYDDMLHETNQIPLNEMVNDVLFTEFAISKDGSKLAYYDFWKGLNVYDVGTGNTEQLINVDEDIPYENRKNILSIDALYFEEDGRGLVFSAQTDKNNVTYDSWGRINIDGSKLENHILDKGLGNAVSFREGRLVLGEDSLTFCSTMGYVNVEEQTPVYATDVPAGRTVGGPKVSQNGAYFAVTQIQDKSVQISIYRTEDFSLLYQETISDDEEAYFYRIPKVYLFDELKGGIICLGGHNEIPLKTVVIDFQQENVN